MNLKFQVYAQTRATRQLAGDVAEILKQQKEEARLWRDIEWELCKIESKLERMNLKD